jgi:hypothetical protein
MLGQLFLILTAALSISALDFVDSDLLGHGFPPLFATVAR